MGIRERQGKCRRCALRWCWYVNRRGNPKLRDSYCPHCGDPLARTSYAWTGGAAKWCRKPATEADAVILQRVRQLREAKQMTIPGAL